jgi:tRNA pseudouridine38-40 synthase
VPARRPTPPRRPRRRPDLALTAPHGATDEPASLPEGGGLVRVRLDLGYDGTGFAGWAAQPGLRTVQGVLEAGLARVLRLPSATTVVAGRTDAGVHARGQVCHVDVPAPALAAARGRRPAPGGPGPEEAALRARLRGVLPDDLRVVAATRAPDGFDARFSALRRAYAYRLSDDPAGVPPLRRHEVAGVRGPLDVTAMAAAGAGLLGVHDFAAFCRRREGAGTVRGLQRLDVVRDPARDPGATGDPGGTVVVLVEADAFCHSMVRALVGALVAVGQGRHDPDWPARVLASRARQPGVQVAPAHGLVLERVDYPPPERLGERARRARARRALPGVDPRTAWHARGMSEPTPVTAEPQDHDGVLEMGELTDDRVTSVEQDTGGSPMERERHVGRYGLSADEAHLREPLDERLAQEEPDAPAGSGGAIGAGGSAELLADADDDGELLDDQVGGVRSGRLVEPDQGGGPDTEGRSVASDVGIAGGAASAEEAAVHVVADDDLDPLAEDERHPG